MYNLEIRPIVDQEELTAAQSQSHWDKVELSSLNYYNLSLRQDDPELQMQNAVTILFTLDDWI